MSEQKPPSIAPSGSTPGRVTPPAAAEGTASGRATFTPDEPIGVVPVTGAAGSAPESPAAGKDRPAPAPRPASRPSVETVDDDGAPRRVRLAIARVDPWSVMKLSFLLAVAAGIMLVVAAAVVWQTLDGLNVFTNVNDMIVTLGGDEKYAILDAVSFRRTVSLATVIGVVDIVLLTALATLGAFLYNIVAALVGGLHLTLTDD
ncbi:DUF3566 domain-containing protein [Actinotalea sp.]|uniref:DUF3566 domain-containing protein n=1 Tax=Actinotalea sp. TaxID=1872145 RepID=UPI00356919E4